MAALMTAEDVLHPLDESARRQLEGVPLLKAAVSKYMSSIAERRERQLLLSNAVRLGPKQMPEVYRLLPPICDAFGLEVPELFLMRGPANAITMGHTRTAIVIYNELLEDLAEDEVQAVLAHECGHILAQHVLYRQMALAMVRAGQNAGILGGQLAAVASVASVPLQAALLNWYRKSELTADRAAIAYLGDPEPMQRALFHLVGVPKWTPGEISFREFGAQAEEFDLLADSTRLDRYLAREIEATSTHPIPAVRTREMTLWASSPEFHHISTRERVVATACVACGFNLEPEWSFCQRCGAAVVAPQEALEP